MSEIKCIRVFGVMATIAIIMVAICFGVICNKLTTQQRQIDHICQILPQVLVDSDPLRHGDFKRVSYRDLESRSLYYALHFANYQDREALLFCWAKQQHFLVYNLPKGLLEGWHRYSDRKLPLE